MPKLEPSHRREALETQRQLKKIQRRKRWLRIALYGLLALLLMVGGLYYFARKGTEGLSVHVEGELIPIQNHLLVLVLGMDEIEPNHTDSIMLASLNSRTGHIGVLSIPRDTRVQIPGRTGFHRINVAHAYGGPATTVRTAESLLGVSIDHWIRLEFSGFRQVVDTVGGVEIHIPRPMVYTDKAQDLYIDLQPGTQRLDGDKALQYVRFRADGLGDVALADPVAGIYKGRVERQLEFVRALAKQILQPSMLVRAPVIIPQLMQAIDTNLPAEKAVRLAGSIGRIDVEKMETVVLPGVAQTIGGASYWVPNTSSLKEAVNRVLLGRDGMVQVAVLNGNGTAGIASHVAEQLKNENFYISTVGNADRYDYPNTWVYSITGKTMEAQRIANLLGGRIFEDAHPSMIEGIETDVLVVVGLDYKVR